MTGARRARIRIAAATIGMVMLMATAGGLAVRWWPRRSPLEGISRHEVRRADLEVTIRAGGRIESSQRTLIECDLENLQFRNEGRNLNASGASRILELIPDGTMVKEGDVLCRLDSSEYEEMVRQQTIKLGEARAERTHAELTLKAAELAVVEFKKGTWSQQTSDLRGRIILAESEVTRQTERLAWARDMAEAGYLASTQLSAEELAMARAEINLKQLRGTEANLLRFGGPITAHQLEGQVEIAARNLRYANSRFEREEERLGSYRRQVELCTVRAPHDGFVIYANEDDDDDPKIELGAIVHQRMDLFYLPDLTQMEVQAIIHETVVRQVRGGMPARIRVEGLPGYVLEGHVLKVAPLPMETRRSRTDENVKNYLGRIRLDSVPRGVLPGMSAEVEVVTDLRRDALTIPPEALTFEDGREVCYVASSEGLERREVKVGRSTPDLLEVTEGLAEGDEVVLNPKSLEALPPIVADSTDRDETIDRDEATEVVAVQ